MGEKEQQKLMIPAQTSDRADYIQGIGKKEVSIIVISLLIGVVLVLFGLFTGGNLLAWTFAAFFEIAVTIIVVRRDAINESVVDKIRIIKIYQKSQKKYQYKQYDIYNLDAEQEG